MPQTCPECGSQFAGEAHRCSLRGDAGDLVGRTVGSYRVVARLGGGGMGAVYRAEHPLIASRVAIKFLHPQLSADRKIVERFFNEARAVNLIGHDNIVRILDLDVTEDGRHYFVMELLEGRTLQALVADGQKVPLPIAGPILLQLCEALQAAHDRQIFHRDVKPANVYLISRNGRKNYVKVVDFGIAKLAGESSAQTAQTQVGLVMGTPAYMSPEQAGGQSSRIDGRSDVYSVGVLMFQMATGRLPFTGPSFAEVLIGHMQKPPPPPRGLAPELPAAYEALILAALEKDPERRPRSMTALRDGIASVLAELGIPAGLPDANAVDAPPPAPPSKAPPGGAALPPTRLLGRGQLRRRASLFLALSLALAGAAAAFAMLARNRPAPPTAATAEEASIQIPIGNIAASVQASAPAPRPAESGIEAAAIAPKEPSASGPAPHRSGPAPRRMRPAQRPHDGDSAISVEF